MTTVEEQIRSYLGQFDKDEVYRVAHLITLEYLGNKRKEELLARLSEELKSEKLRTLVTSENCTILESDDGSIHTTITIGDRLKFEHQIIAHEWCGLGAYDNYTITIDGEKYRNDEKGFHRDDFYVNMIIPILGFSESERGELVQFLRIIGCSMGM